MTIRTQGTLTATTVATVQEWRCTCGTRLGLYRDNQIQIRGASGQLYVVGSPVVTTCPSCQQKHVLDLRPDAA